ncbi:hypothetical protein CVIRNUC_007018 [Coccomyxa viridis]|uniref:Peptidase S49 domain-containing protein n=1 Tax=Coccomyxa viridis TaxID=1274662 RepID=A0AAV1I9C8_9CHLO|nr:hypothetical protein CVIRNUC_007018 [Coccomyxa viridis]
MLNSLARRLFLGRGNATAPIVNVVRMEGIIASSRGARGPQARRIISLERVEKWLKRAFMPGMSTFRPSAVAVIITSPGGSAAQSELIHQRIRSLAKQTGTPVITFAEDVAASGGYWLMCAGDEMASTATSLVGSIGVITSGFGLHKVLEKYEIERRVFTAGKYKDQLDPFRKVPHF